MAALSLAARPSAAQDGPDLLFQAEGQALSGTCTRQAVRLEGNHNAVTLTGPCGSLLVKGVSNQVRFEIVQGGSIRVEGSGNRVAYRTQGAAPSVVALGPENDVAAEPMDAPTRLRAAEPASGPAAVAPQPSPAGKPVASPAASRPASGGPLLLAGDDEQRLQECDGRDVRVSGSRSAYILRGGCKSVTLHGDLLTVQAEMAPGARIAVTGQGSIVSWTVMGKGRAPTATVHGDGSRVQRMEATSLPPERRGGAE